MYQTQCWALGHTVVNRRDPCPYRTTYTNKHENVFLQEGTYLYCYLILLNMNTKLLVSEFLLF